VSDFLLTWNPTPVTVPTKGPVLPKFSNRRTLTEAERTRLVTARENFSDTPPWTKPKVAANRKFRKVLADLYFTGVSQEDLAEATGMAEGSIHQQIRKARQEGLLPQDPRERALPPKKERVKVSTSDRRALTPAEELKLVTLHEALAGPRPKRQLPRRPGRPANPVNWSSPEASRFIAYVQKLADDGVPIARCAEVTGMTRAMLTSRLPRGSALRGIDETVEGKPLTAKMAADLAALTEEVPWGKERREVDGNIVEAEYRMWRKPAGIEALRKAADLLDRGYDLIEIEEAMGFPVDNENYRAQLSRLLRIHATKLDT
jgi:hypothetical protein